MMKLHISLLMAASLLLGISTTAAAASSSKSSSSKSSSVKTTSSKSSSSKSSAVSSCASSAGAVFIDCVDPAWKNVSAYEQRKDYQVQGEVVDGSKGQIARWRIASATEAGHKKVLEISYRDNKDYNALVHFYSQADSADMGAYATGKLVFDIKVLNAGKLNPQLEVLLDCGYPCQSHNYALPKVPLNQWKTLEVPIAKLAEGGLLLDQVNMGFQILPEWNKQNGVIIQLDNIRWVKGTGAAPAPVAHCYEERFETWGLPFSTTSFAGSPNAINGMVRQIIALSHLTPAWATAQDKIGYAPAVASNFQSCALTNGNISAQVYLDKGYVRNAKMQLGFYYQDGNGRRAWFAPMATTSLKANDWSTISTPLANANNQPAFSGSEAGFELSNVTHVGLYFDAKGKKPTAGSLISLDNIFITGQPFASSSSSSTNSSSSFSSASNCEGTQVYSGNSALGFGLPAGNQVYVSLSLTDADFEGAAPELSLLNGSAVLVSFDGQRAIYSLLAASDLSASEQLLTAFSYSLNGTNATLNLAVYDTASAAINAVNALVTSSASLSSCAASSSSSSAASASAVATSSSVSPVSSSAASSASSAVSCSLKNFSGNIPIGAGLSTNNQAYVALKLTNATFTAEPVISGTTTTNWVAMSTSNRVIYGLQDNGSGTAGNQLLGVSVNYSVTTPNTATSLQYRLYDTPSGAIQDSPSALLATSSYNLDNSCH